MTDAHSVRDADTLFCSAVLRDGISPAELLACLRNYRELLESGWSQATIHPDYKAGQSRLASTGQCGVSSAWLTIELGRRFGLDVDYCFGDVLSPDVTKRLDHHCWVEVEVADADEPWVIDLTCDQIRYFRDQRILLARQSELRSNDVDYAARARTPAAQVAGSPIRHRLAALDRAISMDHR
jgi:hypothetical protein